jgi:hypothetical protein
MLFSSGRKDERGTETASSCEETVDESDGCRMEKREMKDKGRFQGRRKGVAKRRNR